jgi:hypothetical protein
MDRTGNPFIDELLVEPLQVVDGEVAVPEGPGLGIELDRAALERFRMPRLSTPPLGNYSDMVFGREHFNPAPAYETSEVGVG